MLKSLSLGVLLGATMLAGLAGGAAQAQVKEVLVGATYPLSGANAQIGVDAKYAMELAAEIVNGDYDFPLPMAKGKGLTNLGGALFKISFADHQSDPQKGRAEAERLITQEKVAAIVGTYQSGVAATVSQAAERYQVPFISADNSSPSLHTRGLKYFFRPAAHDEMFTLAMFDFFRDIKKDKNIDVGSVSLFWEDTLFGTDSSRVQRTLAAERGVKVLADIKYRANSPSLTAEIQQLKAAGAEVLMPSSYTTDAILLIKTMAEFGYQPKAIVAQAAGFSEQAFFDAAGPRAEGVISRGSFALDLSAKRPWITQINDMFKAKSGKDLNDNTAREFMAIIVLADAMNRAGSIEGDKIVAALQQTNIPGDQTIMPWAAVKFDEKGQNNDATPVLMQRQGGAWKTIWPLQFATGQLEWPMAAK
jgi:branched-chain amino acid transport system substrate-binding protein